MKEFDSPDSSISEGESSTMSSIVKFVSPKVAIHLMQKWKKYMLNVLEDMKPRFERHELLIVDIATIIEAIGEASFVEATLQIRPFKP